MQSSNGQKAIAAKRPADFFGLDLGTFQITNLIEMNLYALRERERLFPWLLVPRKIEVSGRGAGQGRWKLMVMVIWSRRETELINAEISNLGIYMGKGLESWG